MEIMANLSRRRNGLAVAEVACEPEKAQIPIEKHIEDFKSAKRAEKGGRIGWKHIGVLMNSVQRVVDHCHFATTEAIDGLLVDKALTAFVKSGMSLATRDKILSHVKQFCAWLVVHRRLSNNPLLIVKHADDGSDRRHKRRSFTPHEFVRLLQTTQGGPVRMGLTGYSRSMLYLTAASTGFRSREACAITWASFDFGPEPTITLPGKLTKNRKRAMQPIRTVVAAEISRWRQERADEPDDARLWPLRP